MMVRNAAISADGTQVAILSAANRLLIYPTMGGDPKEVAAADFMAPLRWSDDGQWIFAQRLRNYTELPALIFRVHSQTGERKLWKEITPSDPMGVTSVTAISITCDEHSYVY